MNLPLKIAIRYFFSKRKSGGVNASTIITWISLLGYLVGAAALIIVLSVFNGFENLFTSLYSSFDADLKVEPTVGKTFKINQFPVDALVSKQIYAYSFTIEENALLHYGNKQTICTVKAVDSNYTKIVNLEENIIAGGFLLQSGDTNFALVGQGLAYQLTVDPDDQFSPLGVYVPRKGKIDMLNPENAFARGIIFPVGVFAIQDEVDSKYIILPYRFFNRLLQKEGEVSSIEIKLTDANYSNQLQKELQEKVGSNYKVLNRFQQHDSFYKVMKSEKTISYMILVFILLVAAFNTVGSLYMLVVEKSTDLNVLKTMGFTPKMAALVYVLESLLVALIGGVLGILIGGIICWLQQTYGFIPLHSNGGITIDAYPIVLHNTDFIKVFFTIVALGFLTAIYPAYKAYKMVNN